MIDFDDEQDALEQDEQESDIKCINIELESTTEISHKICIYAFLFSYKTSHVEPYPSVVHNYMNFKRQNINNFTFLHFNIFIFIYKKISCGMGTSLLINLGIDANESFRKSNKIILKPELKLMKIEFLYLAPRIIRFLFSYQYSFKI
ncbi:hypothetical protein BpHYR1_013983 [Brachionus plicatilis]|uniref:Uncharacterized protein n=1 Tax=Brachionus plicatilis TaxID=10195 RepID=A0A3M7ST40_BRAPC|nr:hypothetical protein BpHYR1_013983 [Brachionus plicatilis]